MEDHFFAVDVETANADRSSICQIGLVEVKGGNFVSEWSTYVNPRVYFDPWNTQLHGIDARTVSNAPTFPEIADRFRELVHQKYLVSHSAFDRGAIGLAFGLNGLEACQPIWLDSARMARRAWAETDIVAGGVSLAALAAELDINFSHHDALEDAKACAQVALKACAHSGLSIGEWVKRQEQPGNPQALNHNREGRAGGILSGEVVVFTGELSQPRRHMADMVAELGAAVKDSVGKKTTILVVGDQDTFKLKGYKKSQKQRKAEELISAKGQELKIISESDLLELAKA